MARARLKGNAGTASVEFALVLPMLLVLVLGTVEVGFLILSHASMNTTMARVPDLAQRAETPDDLDARLADLAALRLGLGLAEMSFAPVTQSCICPADQIDLTYSVRDCPLACDGGVEALRLYTVIGRVRAPSLIPDGGSTGVRELEARLTVTGP
jgi:hypothetical protein